MKKYGAILLCVIALTACLCFVGCGENSTDGDNKSYLSVYPEDEFSYKISDDCTFHFDAFSAAITDDNSVSKGSEIVANDELGGYVRFLVTVYVKGSVSTDFNGQYVFVEMSAQGMAYAENGAYIEIKDGGFSGEVEIPLFIKSVAIYFKNATLHATLP